MASATTRYTGGQYNSADSFMTSYVAYKTAAMIVNVLYAVSGGFPTIRGS